MISWGPVELSVDQFHGRLSGLVLAEAELGPDDNLFELPPFALRDVTHDERYSGGALAMVTDPGLKSLFTDNTAHTSLKLCPGYALSMVTCAGIR